MAGVLPYCGQAACVLHASPERHADVPRRVAAARLPDATMKKVPLYSRSQRAAEPSPEAVARRARSASGQPPRPAVARAAARCATNAASGPVRCRAGGRVLVAQPDARAQAAAHLRADRRGDAPVDRGQAADRAGIARLRRDPAVGGARGRPDDRRRRRQRRQGARHGRARHRQRRGHHRQRHHPHQPARHQRRQEDQGHLLRRLRVGSRRR